ncbi:ferritin-like domain-containing protein [Mucilaginibacter terrae]|uniref:ferritin-like domain-containing protein n=1 Tax=Mucilaginibacter terrae TaxID=1955052 RepID=UPI00363B8ECF
MNFLNILKEIEEFDPEIGDRINPRRKAISSITGFGSKVAVAALPFALGTLFKKAYGATPTEIVNILNFALTLEYLEYELYKRGTSTTVAATFTTQGQTAAVATDLANITNHELQHINFLIKTINALGGTPRTPLKYDPIPTVSNFDFTGGGKFNAVFTDYDTFLGLAQVFEDTGVRAYKGQAAQLLGEKVVLTAALSIHTVEARHAAHLRMLRRARKVENNKGAAPATFKPWISGTTATTAGAGPNDTGLGANVDLTYFGTVRENATAQPSEDRPININQIGSIETGLVLPVTAAIESFDEPLTTAEIIGIITPFLPRGF